MAYEERETLERVSAASREAARNGGLQHEVSAHPAEDPTFQAAIAAFRNETRSEDRPFVAAG